MSAISKSARKRCPWVGTGDPEYERYHDTEWGVPLTRESALFEKLVLEGFQSGLSWRIILRKREGFRRAFDGFDPKHIARYGKRDIARLMQDEAIVRNRAKIEATIDNANAYLKLNRRTSLREFLWSHLEKGPVQNRFRDMKEIPPKTELSNAISKNLKAEGFRFVGPTTMYAFMQSAGMVNDHLIGCFRHAACAKLQRSKIKL